MPGTGCIAAGAVAEIVVLTADTANQTSTTEAIISAQLTIPANTVRIGTTFEFELAFSAAQGATAQTTPGFVYRLRYGGLTGTIICTANNVITPATTLAATPGFLRGGFTVRTAGATGTSKGWIEVNDPRIVREATTGGIYTRVGKSGSPVTIDTTADKILCVTLVATIADASAITFGESGYIRMVRV
jgi:hypothetical protein